MKLGIIKISLIVAMALFSNVVLAQKISGPSISGGDAPHPALTTMSIQKAVAGVDYPTDGKTQVKAVLALYNEVRIPILKKGAYLANPQAGIDYPTDSQIPRWALFQKVLRFKNGPALLLRLTFENDVLKLNTNSGAINISDISAIDLAQAGIDYPTDRPSVIKTPVLIMNDGTRLVP